MVQGSKVSWKNMMLNTNCSCISPLWLPLLLWLSSSSETCQGSTTHVPHVDCTAVLGVLVAYGLHKLSCSPECSQTKVSIMIIGCVAALGVSVAFCLLSSLGSHILVGCVAASVLVVHMGQCHCQLAWLNLVRSPASLGICFLNLQRLGGHGPEFLVTWRYLERALPRLMLCLGVISSSNVVHTV